MSIDLDIIPTSASPVSWDLLRQKLLAYPFPKADRSLMAKPPVLVDYKTRIILPETTQLVPETVYSLGLVPDHGITVSTFSNAKLYTNEEEYFEDYYACNLASDQRTTLARRWKEIGFSYGLALYGGNYGYLLPLFLATAVVIAELCQGYIVDNDSRLFTLPEGCYTPEQFRSARPTI